MNHEEIESLLRRARPPELPAGLKHRVLQAAGRSAEPMPWLPRVARLSLAACWALIILLRSTTPDVPSGSLPFDHEAFLARAEVIEFIIATGQFPEEWNPPPIQQPLEMELHFRLPRATPSPSQPAT